MSATEFAVPVEDRHFEDYVPGAVFEYGEIPVTEAEIVEFARRFDPQYIHVDRERVASRTDRGVVRTLCEVLNQDREVVLSLRAMNIMACRSAP